MTIYTYITHDHKDLRNKLERIEQEGAEASDVRTDLFNEFKITLLRHTKSEEDTFYSALADKTAAEDFLPGLKKDHAIIEDYLHKLTQKDLKGQAWFLEFLKLKKLLTAHFNTEETTAFKTARALFNEQEALAIEEDMKSHKRHERENRDIRLREYDSQEEYVQTKTYGRTGS